MSFSELNKVAIAFAELHPTLRRVDYMEKRRRYNRNRANVVICFVDENDKELYVLYFDEYDCVVIYSVVEEKYYSGIDFEVVDEDDSEDFIYDEDELEGVVEDIHFVDGYDSDECTEEFIEFLESLADIERNDIDDEDEDEDDY